MDKRWIMGYGSIRYNSELCKFMGEEGTVRYIKIYTVAGPRGKDG